MGTGKIIPGREARKTVFTFDSFSTGSSWNKKGSNRLLLFRSY